MYSSFSIELSMLVINFFSRRLYDTDVFYECQMYEPDKIKIMGCDYKFYLDFISNILFILLIY